MKEEWKTIPGHPDYEVSSIGEIKSLFFKNGAVRKKRGEAILLKPYLTPYGYFTVSLKGKAERIHRLVLEAFIGPCPDGMEGCHGDGNPKNNRLDNLRWATKKENAADKIKHGTYLCGEKNYNSKLKNEDIKIIRFMASISFGPRAIEIFSQGPLPPLISFFVTLPINILSVIIFPPHKF